MPDVSNEIRGEPRPNCFLCGATGVMRYENLRDRLFGTPGLWNLRKCSQSCGGLLWLDPLPLEEDIGRAYRTYYTHQRASPATSARKRIIQFVGEGYLARKYRYKDSQTGFMKRCSGLLVYLAVLRKARLDFRLMHLVVQPNGRLLEVGCGNGEVLHILQNAGWQAEGVDFDPAAVAMAHASGLQVRLGTLESQGYPSDTFDAVVSSHTIEHLHNPVRFLSESHRILKPHGRLSIVTPNARSLCHQVFKQSWHGLDPPRHLHIFSVSALHQLVRNAGFREVRISTSIRDADRLFASSWDIQRTGQHVWGSPQPFLVRLMGTLFQLVEFISGLLGCQTGEEIVVTAYK